MFQLFGLRSFALWLCALACCADGWAQALLPLSENAQFRSNLSGWNSTTANATILASPAGNGRLKLSGTGGLWQYVPVSGFSDNQLVNCQAFKQLKPGATTTNPGWAGIGVDYYDVGWGFIDGYETQINVSNSTDIFGDKKLLACSLGAAVPPAAAHAIVWVANDDASTDVFVDNLTLFDYFVPSSQLAARPEGTYPGALQDLNGQSQETSGLEFWNVQGSVDMGTGAIGTVGTPSSISQEFKLTPGETYSIEWYTTSFRSVTAPTANIGVDFFDANWVRLDGNYSQIVPTSLGFNSGVHTAEVPSQAVHSIVWVWVDSLTENDGNQQLGPIQLLVRPTNNTPPVVALARPVSDRGPGDIGFEVLLDYSDDEINFPSVFTFLMSLTGPTGAQYPIFWEVLANDEEPTRWTIKLTSLTAAGNPINWSEEELGTYTLVIPTDSILDGVGSPLNSPLTITFENLGEVLQN